MATLQALKESAIVRQQQMMGKFNDAYRHHIDELLKSESGIIFKIKRMYKERIEYLLDMQRRICQLKQKEFYQLLEQINQEILKNALSNQSANNFEISACEDIEIIAVQNKDDQRSDICEIENTQNQNGTSMNEEQKNDECYAEYTTTIDQTVSEKQSLTNFEESNYLHSGLPHNRALFEEDSLQSSTDDSIDRQINILQQGLNEKETEYDQILNEVQTESAQPSNCEVIGQCDDIQIEEVSVPQLEPIKTINQNTETVSIPAINSEPLACDICANSTSFFSPSLLLLHIDSHIRQCCPQCNIEFGATLNDEQKNEQCYSKHEKIANYMKKAQRLYECNVCPFKTMIPNNYNQHQLIHPQSPNKSHSAPTNPTVSKQTHSGDEGSISSAQNQQNSECCAPTRYHCEECNRYFKNGQALGGHRSTMHSKRRNRQNISASALSSNNVTNALDGHRSVHNDKKNESSQIGVDHSNIYNVQPLNSDSHKISNDNGPINIKTHQCHICASVFYTESEFKAHCHSVHKPIPPKLYKCDADDCNYDTPHKSSLIIHIRTHTNERPFKCSIDDCKHDFTTKSNLKVHIKKMHDKKKDHLCLINNCGKSFSSGYELKVHQYIHTGEKPYKCGYCAESFNKSSKKNKHEKDKHIGWKCPFCEEKFDAESQLNNHRKAMHPNMKINAGTKWFKYGCEKCERRFKTAEKRDTHYAQCTIGVKTAKIKKYKNEPTTSVNAELNILKSGLNESSHNKKKEKNEDEVFVPRTKLIENMNGKRRKSERLSNRKNDKKNAVENGSRDAKALNNGNNKSRYRYEYESFAANAESDKTKKKREKVNESEELNDQRKSISPNGTISGNKRRLNINDNVRNNGQPSPKKRRIKLVSKRKKAPSRSHSKRK